MTLGRANILQFQQLMFRGPPAILILTIAWSFGDRQIPSYRLREIPTAVCKRTEIRCLHLHHSCMSNEVRKASG